MLVSSPNPSTDTPPGPPSARSAAYYLDWIGELSEFHRAGMLNDEDFAYQRAERLVELLDRPRRRWLAWIHVGVPLAGLAGATAWWLTQDMMMIAAAAVTVVLCVFAALGRLSREKCHHLTMQERSDILYALLSENLITSEEFLAFDEGITGRRDR